MILVIIYLKQSAVFVTLIAMHCG